MGITFVNRGAQDNERTEQMTAFLIVLLAGLFLSSHVVECNVRSLQASSSSSAHVSGGEGARASAGQSSSTCEGSCLLPFIAERSSTGGFAYSNRAGSATA